MTRMFLPLTLGCLLGAGCVDPGDGKPDESDVKGGVDGKAEAWGPSDNPALFSTNLEFRIAQLPATGQATNVPWAGNYWPVYEDSINHKWAGPNSEAPSPGSTNRFSTWPTTQPCSASIVYQSHGNSCIWKPESIGVAP